MEKSTLKNKTKSTGKPPKTVQKKKTVLSKKKDSKSANQKTVASPVKSLNAFHSANYRRRKKGLPDLSWNEYNKQKVAKDSAGRFHPIKQVAITKAQSIFGKEIFSKKKVCNKCGEKKVLADFSMRFSQKVILNVCKNCEQERQKKYWKQS